MKIPFNRPAITGTEKKYLDDVFIKERFSGDGFYSRECQAVLEKYLDVPKVLLTTSCTDALEMAALLLNIQAGDEVIMPSFTFVSTSNAFVLRGAKIVFVDIKPETMNLNESLIEAAITPRTKAIVLVHYAGWSCDMEKVIALSKKYNLPVIEDAAQALGASFKGKKLGTFGALSCFSFHETKNIQCGEGGALVINDEKFIQRAEIIREKGTNRSQFFRGQTDKYTWVDVGSSFLPSELNAAFLYSQLQSIDMINSDRVASWNKYKKELSGIIELIDCPDYCNNNAHLFAVKLENINERTDFIDFLKLKNISAVFHYIPLHASEAGKKYGVFSGVDEFTSKESERLVRLPLYYGMKTEEVEYTCKAIKDFISQKR